MNNPQNAAINRARREGFTFHGATAREWERPELEAKLEVLKREFKPFGSQAKILRKVEFSQFRDRTDKFVYLGIYVKYSEAHLEFLEQEKIRRERERDEAVVRHFIDTLTPAQVEFLKKYIVSKG